MLNYKAQALIYLIIYIVLCIFSIVYINTKGDIFNLFDLVFLIFYLILFLVILYKPLKNIFATHETTLCFVVKDRRVLMMYRNKKENDIHEGKWNGLGGKVEGLETPRRCVLREANEEAGIDLKKLDFVGRIDFYNFSKKYSQEIMYSYVAFDYQNEIVDCNEGELHWINIEDVLNRPLWEGDKHFLEYIVYNKKFKGVMYYDKGKLKSYCVNTM